jgi:hypothetical protein
MLQALLGLGSPAASARFNGTAKHPVNGSKVLSNGFSCSENGSATNVHEYAVGSPRTNGLFLNGSHQSKSNGVMKLSSSMPGNYSILTSSDLLVGMHSATGSPRAKGISASS